MGTANYEGARKWIAPKLQPSVLTARTAQPLAPQPDPAVALQRTVSGRAPELRPVDILTLQRSVGNRAVQRLVYGERDANGVAPDADIAVNRAGASSGQVLPNEVRGRFENSLGADLSGVRVHTGSESAEAAEAVGAKAYTVGQDIHFGAGYYAPGDPGGVHLLAHEVAHAVQNQGAVASRLSRLEVSHPADAAEVEADRVADAMVAAKDGSVKTDEDEKHRK